MRMRIFGILWILVGIASVSGCGFISDSQVVSVSAAKDPLWADRSVLWTPGQVAVCWNNPNAATSTQRDGVRNAVARTWSFAGNLEFTGWDTCPSGNFNGVRISWRDDSRGPRTTGFGTQIDGLDPGLILDNVFNVFQVSPATPNYSFVITCTTNSTAAQIQECVENIAVHEFGHILGFHHEQNAPGAASRLDFPAGCSNLVQRGDTIPDGGVLYANFWDLNSVMNYCSPAYGGPELTEHDFAGMIQFYGISPRFVGALVGAGVI